MGQIRLTPTELQDYAKQFGNESANTGELIGRLNDMLGQLNDVWEGESSRAFQEQYIRLKPSFIKMQDLLGDIQTQLGQTASILEQTDRDIAGQINR